MDESAADLLRLMMSQDNETRQGAEQRFEQIPPPQKLLFLLAAYSAPAQSDYQRLLSMVLLRRLMTSDYENFYPALTPEQQHQLKQHLLSSIPSETSPQVRNRICECIAELARNLADDMSNVPWPELHERMFEWVRGPSDSLRQATLHIFADFPLVFGIQDQTIANIKNMLLATLQPTDTMMVRIEAAKCVSAFLRSDVVDTPEKQAVFADIIPVIVRVLADQKNSDAEEDDTVLETLTEISEHCPKIIRPHLISLLDITTAYICDENTLENRRNLCLELVVTLCESAPAMMRKFGARHIETLLHPILKMMADIEDDTSWDLNEDADDDENDSPTVVGESSLDRLAIALGGKILLPTAMKVVTPLLNSPNWKERHAAIMAISSMGEGCRKQMTAILESIVRGILNFFNDSHPRVRYAALNCLGQMANDFSPLFEKKFHDIVLPEFCRMLADGSHPRVQTHAGAALVNFFEECPRKILSQYIPVIATPLASILQSKVTELAANGKKLVLEQVIVTTSSFADGCQAEFTPFYDNFVPPLKYIIENATSKELEVLRGKAIECISLIGSAVGKERFFADAAGVMEILLNGQTEQLSEDSQILSYMIFAWMRLCKILGKDFEPYLPHVMPSVLKTAALSPQMTLVDDDQVVEEGGNDEWTYVAFDERRSFGVRTAGLEEKATAFEMLLCYAKELKESFSSYAPEVMKVAVPALQFYFHEGVRCSAANCIPELLSCAKAADGSHLPLWTYAVPEVLTALDEEHEFEVLPELVDCISKSIGVVGAEGLNEELVKTLMGHALKYLNQHFARDKARHDLRNDEDYDEDVEEKLREEVEADSYLLTQVEELIRQLCRALGAAMIPYLDEVVPLFGQLVQSDRPRADIQWALCFYDDITECVGEIVAVRYKDVFLDKLIDYLVHPSAEIRQAASYGIGIIAQFGGDELTSYLTKALPLLAQAIGQLDSRNQDNIVATENAISAVAKVIKYRKAAVPNMDEAITSFLGWLPITEDEEEISPCFELVCSLVEQNHPIALGQNNANLPHIVKCMAEVFGCKSLDKDSEVGQRCIVLLRMIQGNESLFSACVAGLNQAQKDGLQYALTPS